MDNNLTKLIDRATYVSFDIFDTAVLRAVQKPTDVFDLVESCHASALGALPFEFKTVRVESEKRAREKAWRLGKSAEITLAEIYRCMAEDFAVAGSTAENLKRLEIDVETKVCTRNEFIYSVYTYCIEHEKKVVFMSDMYLPLETVEDILKNSGYAEFYKVFLSSAAGVTKSTGKLYEVLLDEVSCRPQEIVHVGDNYDSDVKMAEKHGLKTYFYEKCIDRAFRAGVLKKNAPAGSMTQKNTVEKSIYNALVINHFCSKRESGDNNAGYDFWTDFGYKCVGVLFFGFTRWLLEQVKKDGVERLYFLARDGYIMKKVYDVMAHHVENTPPSAYMYASRRALNLPAITELDDTTMDFLVSGTSTLTVAQFLERLGFNPLHYADTVREAGFSAGDDKVVTGNDYYRLRMLFLRIADDIREKAGGERRQLNEYFHSIGMFDSKKVGVVDIGWHGTLQYSINKIIALSDEKVATKGYYLGTFLKSRELYDGGLDMNAYLCEFGRPEHYLGIIKLCVEIFEFIHTAPHGSVIHFRRVNGTLEPVFDRNYEAAKIEKAHAVQKGAFDFIEELVGFWKHFPFLTISKETAITPLYEVLRNPSYEEAVNLGNLEHAEGFGDVCIKRFIARPPEPVKILTNPYNFIQRYKQAFWKRGFRKRLFSLEGYVKKVDKSEQRIYNAGEGRSGGKE